MMRKLADVAAILRSKNAGIGYITVDVIFSERCLYESAKRHLTREKVVEAYGLGHDMIDAISYFDEGQAIKVTFERQQLAGGLGLGDVDIYGNGQYAPILDVAIPE